ncbi:MAG: ribose-phosphate pyrophosphokinase [Steroidobacteraceae bacterium]
MTQPLLFALPGEEAFTAALARHLDADIGALEIRRFPDGESYVRLDTDVAGREVAFVCGLHEPDPQFLPLVFAARVAKDLGAARVGLVAPYLAYMRQDVRFKPGEAITSVYFADMLSHCFAWLVTVDPHLHRWKSLGEIYSLDARVVPAAPVVGEWIKQHVPNPVLIGPDSESSQWVTAIAALAGAPFVVLEKTRHGDRDVTIAVNDDAALRDRTPVLVDDIISTAHTMMAVVRQLRDRGLPAPVCIGVHGVFAPDAYRELSAAGAARIVTTNTIPHETSEIDLSRDVADAVESLIP